MRNRLVSGIVTGGILAATASMYAMTRISPRQRRRMMKTSKRVMTNIMDNMGIY